MAANAGNKSYLTILLMTDFRFLRMHWGADVITTWLLLDGRGDDGRMGNAGLVEAVWGRGYHVRGETAGHQAERAKGGKILTVGFNSKTLLTRQEKVQITWHITALPYPLGEIHRAYWVCLD